jgi:GTP-binding protein
MAQKPNPFRQATYLINAHHLRDLPPDVGAEIAFAGRSNAGKSSALNTICDQVGLARTSKTPGRTQQLVVFTLDDTRRLVDLPGYGYAKVPDALRAHWRSLIDLYLRTRESLKGFVLIMDSRHPLKEFDRQMLAYAATLGWPCHCLLTKADKLTRNESARTLAEVRRELAAIAPQATVQLFSALKKTGVDEARQTLAAWMGFGQPIAT